MSYFKLPVNLLCKIIIILYYLRKEIKEITGTMTVDEPSYTSSIRIVDIVISAEDDCAGYVISVKKDGIFYYYLSYSH